MNSDKKTCYVVLINGHETITNGVYLKNKKIMVEPSGIEPLTSCVQGRRSPS